MQSSRGLHLHGATPSPPDPSDAVPNSFPPSESVPPSPPYYINPLTDQRLTGSMMSYPQVDHQTISGYARAPTLLWKVTDAAYVAPTSAHLPITILYRGPTITSGTAP